MSKSMLLRIIVLLFSIAVLSGGVSTSLAAGETFQVVSVNTVGCNSGDFGMTVERANLDGGSYTVHTVVTVGGLVYMNEAASISINGLSGWNVFNNFTYGAVSNPGTYPIPSGQQMTLDFTLERPIGTILYAWRLVVDGCDTGNIISNAAVGVGPIGGGSAAAPVPGCDVTIYIPPSAVGARITATTPVYWAPGELSDEVFPAGLSLRAIGVDETGAYTKVLYVCGYYWVPTGVIGPNFDAVWNGAALPTDVVQ
ncbi:MAG: hypothetical protein HY866_03880 [Chloroflexi bacterium]|nr:hypothetical protein [Chloroflexota bacterium]